MKISDLPSYWQCNEKDAIRWGNAFSSYFEISIGIQQGEILSPILCILYTDSLSMQMLSSRIGYHTTRQCVNHIAYADDIVLYEPSIKGLQTLIDVCFEIAGENGILYNETKNKCIDFWSRLCTQCVLPLVSSGMTSLRFVDAAVYHWLILSSNLNDSSDVYKQIIKKSLTRSEIS